MTDPLPGYYADRLLDHAAKCAMCRMARIASQPQAVMCDQGKRLVLLTIEQRHGRIEDDDDE